MSALGHKQTFAVQNGMSALPPRADMCGALADVREVPIADIQHNYDCSGSMYVRDLRLLVLATEVLKHK